MSINSKLSIALILVAFCVGSTAFAQDAIPATGIPGHAGSGDAQMPLHYDAQGGRHVGMIVPQALGRVAPLSRAASIHGVHAFAQVVRSARLYDSESKDMLSPSSLDYAPDLNSR